MKAEGNGEDVQWVVDGRAGVSFNDEGLVISPVFFTMGAIRVPKAYCFP